MIITKILKIEGGEFFLECLRCSEPGGGKGGGENEGKK